MAFTDAARQGWERWVRARYPEALTAEQEQVLLGSLMGDGCLYKPRTAATPYFVETHTPPQRDYLFWKAEVFAPLHSRTLLGRPESKAPLWYLRTGRAPLLTAYRALFYPKGTKIVPDAALDRIEPLGLAVWLMDDGSVGRRHITISTDCWPLEDQQRICAWFDSRWGLHPVPQFQPTRTAWQVRFRVDDSTALMRLVGPYVHPLFRAKWRLDDAEQWRPAMSKADASRLGNATRTARIKAGILRVGWHTGTVRVGG